VLLTWAAIAAGQTAPGDLKLDWRRIGNAAIDAPSGPVTGAADRVWYQAGRLHASARGRSWRFEESGQWMPVSVEAPAAFQREAFGRRFAPGEAALRSDDGGRQWTRLTSPRTGPSIGAVRDIAVLPASPDVVAVAAESGVWQSLDGGSTWAGLNEELPNLPVRALVAAPAAGRGVMVMSEAGALEWQPGARTGWSRLSAPPVEFPARKLWSDATDPRLMLRVDDGRLYRTMNGGTFWDEVPGPAEARLRAAVADRESGTVYVAADRGVFAGRLDFNSAALTVTWRRLAGGLPDAPAVDVLLGPGNHQLYAAFEGWGVYAALAPHRLSNPRVVNAADLSGSVAAPGTLLSVLGSRVTAARSPTGQVALLTSQPGEAQVQVPFSAQGPAFVLEMEAESERWRHTAPLEPTAPAIFVDRDGAPMLLDGDSGVLLDPMRPIRANGRLQILSTGLGRVRPEWTAGLEAPLESPPQVVAPVRVLLDGMPLEVTRATLAPGYTGIYLVEAIIPAAVNAGSSEVILEAGGSSSNRVRVYIEP
jgi:uncharacterized protein (TIGR03437 family)